MAGGLLAVFVVPVHAVVAGFFVARRDVVAPATDAGTRWSVGED